MKKIQQLSMVAVLTFMLATSAFAGDIPIGIAPPPPPGSSSPAPGQIETPGDAATPGITQTPGLASVEEVALNLLQSMLSVF